MKYIKNFENSNIEPEVGDYVIAHYIYTNSSNKTNNFMLNNVGRIVSIDNGKYIIVYKQDIPFKHIKYARRISLTRDNIDYFSKNEENLEIIVQTNKYNL